MARAVWAEMRAHFSLLCGGMPPKPWVGAIRAWCLETESWDGSFVPVEFRWSCPPPTDVELRSVLTMGFRSEHATPVAMGFRSLVSGLVDDIGGDKEQ